MLWDPDILSGVQSGRDGPPTADKKWERLPAAIAMKSEQPQVRAAKYPVKGSFRLRKGRWSQRGHVYFITTSVADREPLFREEAYCQIVFQAVQWLTEHNRWECFCTMIMPDHVHLVVKLQDGWSIEQLMHSLKSYTSKQINKLKGRQGSIWQEGYFDHCIRKEESLREIILYCYHNPVRRGLVNKASEYPYWKCKFRL